MNYRASGEKHRSGVDRFALEQFCKMLRVQIGFYVNDAGKAVIQTPEIRADAPKKVVEL